ncbi:MAG: DUF2157 domain-containing protein [Candidatus Peribacteraceae bacterium]|nr:DUF2157 domain-containing protein [Candidatus Peribacteraceae bacterium]
MDKQSLLSAVRAAAAAEHVTRAELLAAFDQGTTTVMGHQSRLTRALYIIGGLIVLFGIGVFVTQQWPSLNSTTRILVTFGCGIVAHVMGVLFLSRKNTEEVSQVFLVLGFFLLPTGILVAFREFDVQWDWNAVQSLAAFALLLLYLPSYLVKKTPAFLLFSVFAGTWLFFAFTNVLLLESMHDWRQEFHEYRVLVTGCSYLLLGWSFRIRPIPDFIANLLFAVGSILVLGATLEMGRWRLDHNVFWEIVHPFLSLGFVYLSVLKRIQSFLIWGSVFMMAYIVKISGEYFQQSLGWPLALVIAGLLLIGMGYASVSLNRKYMKA